MSIPSTVTPLLDDSYGIALDDRFAIFSYEKNFAERLVSFLFPKIISYKKIISRIKNHFF